MDQHAAANPARGNYYDHDAEYRRRRERGWRGWERTFDRQELDIFRALGLLAPGLSIIEFGAGAGEAAIMLAREASGVLAVDASPTAIAMAHENLREQAADLRARVQLLCADVLHSDWNPTQRFDRVLDIHCLHAMVQPRHRRRFLRRAHDCLHAQGLLLSANMCGLPHDAAVLATVDPSRRVSCDGTRYFADEAQVRAELAETGFEIVYWNRRHDPTDVDYLLFAARVASP